MQASTEISDERGFALVELLVAMALIGLVMAAIFGLLSTGQQSYLQGSNQVEAQQSARVAIERMVREIREAGYDPTGSGFAAITAQTATGLTLQNDWNGNGVPEPGLTVSLPMADGTLVQRGEQVTYSLSGSTLQRQESGIDIQPQPFVEGVEQLTFQYQDATGGIPATSAAIRTVIVTLRTRPENQPTAYSLGRVTVVMTDSVRLRNR